MFCQIEVGISELIAQAGVTAEAVGANKVIVTGREPTRSRFAIGMTLRYNHARLERTTKMKRQRLFLVFVLAGITAWALAAGSWIKLGGRPAPQDSSTNFTLEGTISDLSSGKFTVDTGGQMIFHVTYDKNTTIHKKDGSAGASTDLVAGAKVKVVGDLNNSGVVEAHEIDLE